MSVDFSCEIFVGKAENFIPFLHGQLLTYMSVGYYCDMVIDHQRTDRFDRTDRSDTCSEPASG